MSISKTYAAAALASGVLLASAVGIAAAVVPNSAAPVADQVSNIRVAAQSAVAAWQTLFVEEPQVGVTVPGQAKLQAKQLSVANAANFVTAATTSAKTLFSGEALDTLERSLSAEAQTSSPAAIAAAARAQGMAVQLSGGYTICVAAGAKSFHFTRVSVNGTDATVELTAYAWTTNVDYFADGRAQLDTAQGPGAYHLHLSRSPSGVWLVTSFDAAPLPS